MVQRIVAGQASKITFYFYDDSGTAISITSPTATLYNTIGAAVVDSNIALTQGSNNQYYVIYTPDASLSGTYYMVASGTDSDGIVRYSTKFLEVIQAKYNRSLLTIEDVLKFVDAEIVDKTLLEPLIWTATEWVESFVGGIIFPTVIEKEYYRPAILDELTLNYTPVVEVSAVYSCDDGQDDSALSSDKYALVDADIGLIKLTGSYSTEYKVTYTAGFNPIPTTIYTAVGFLVGQLYDKVKYQNITRLKVENISAVIDKQAINQIKEMLIPFRKVN